MIDYARIKIRAGEGGRGAGSFEHIKGKRRGKADGGDGGRGGNVYFVATANLNTLEPFRYVKEYKAQDGVAGQPKKRTGAEAVDLKIKVPVGTQLKVTSDKGVQIYDLVEAGQEILLAGAGEGGRGNAHLRDEFGRRPFAGEAGHEGEFVELTLELKLIADVGLVGLPNAGKSTLISKLTHATPKIANYPFTTLEPNLGVLEYRDKHIVLADIPGLIEGASEGKGLGDLFLRHIERTKILVHMIDVSVGNVWESYQTIRAELKIYSKELVKKREIIVVNKIDLVEADQVELVLQAFKAKRKKIFKISAQNGEGIEELTKEISKKI